ARSRHAQGSQRQITMKDLKNPEYVAGHGLLKGKAVLITAAAGAGIGFAAATRAVEEGCRAIVISDVHEGGLAAWADKPLQDSGQYAVCGKLCYVTDEAKVRPLNDYAEGKLLSLDFLINHAGLGTTKARVEMAAAEWHQVTAATR